MTNIAIENVVLVFQEYHARTPVTKASPSVAITQGCIYTVSDPWPHGDVLTND